MFQLLNKKLITTFLVVAGVGIATILPMSHHSQNTIKNVGTFNTKEKDKKAGTMDSKNEEEKNGDKDIKSLSDKKKSIDNSQQSDNTNNQKTIISKSKKSSENKDTSEQKKINSKLKESSKKNINERTNTNSQLKKANTNEDVTKKEKTNATPTKTTFRYDRTTSIYANDNITLLRIEYYINNKLTYYSVVEQYKSDTKSYIEKIYQCNRETNIDPLIRTDVYVNGDLIKSY